MDDPSHASGSSREPVVSDVESGIIAVWSHPTSDVASGRSDDRTLNFTVKGEPSSQLRYNRGKAGNAYDPSKKAKLEFRSQVVNMLGLSDNTRPLYRKGVFLSITVIFRMRRPNNHFVGGKREVTKLRSNAPLPFSVTKCDVDNLLKFVMDAMNTLLYEDDKQVAAVHAFRLFDGDGTCEGSTTVSVIPVTGTFPPCHGLVL